MSRVKALVVGGTTVGGIGHGLAEYLSNDMADGVFTPTPEEMDVTNQYDITQYLSENGPFSHIFYSAGINQLRWVEELSSSYLQDVFAVNVFGLALVVGEHREMFPEAPVTVTAVVSDAAEYAMRGSLAYCSSKAALAHSLRCMARELGPHGWRVNGVSPGMMEDTPMTRQMDKDIPEFRDWTAKQARDYEMKSNPLGRRVRVGEVVEVLLDLAFGPQALNGQILTINGGK